MNVGDLIAPYLGLRNGEKATADNVQVSNNEVTTFRLQIPNQPVDYTVHFVTEGDNAETLQGVASVAGFYNSKYFYEMAKFERLTLGIGSYNQALKIEDQGKSYPVFVTERYGESFPINRTLRLEELYQVAEQLSKLHAFCLPEPDAEAKATLDGNYEIISTFRSDKFVNELPGYLTAITNELAHFFKNPNKIPELVHTLYQSPEDLTYVPSESSSIKQSQVLCHGELTADKLVFNDKGKLTEIRAWDNIHYGNPAEDLTYLIITSAPTEIRRDRYMSIFRRYYYPLVDMIAPKFKLIDLNEQFKKLHKYVMLASLPQLINALQSESDGGNLEFAQRWESALEDAVAIEKNEYPSDNEDVFFSK